MLQDTISHAGPGDRYTGFRKLWGRVIQRAIYDWVAYRESSKLQQRKLAENAENWLFKPSEVFNSFETVCHLLDIDPEVIRRRARTFTKDEVLKAEHIERSGHRDIEERILEATKRKTKGLAQYRAMIDG